MPGACPGGGLIRRRLSRLRRPSRSRSRRQVRRPRAPLWPGRRAFPPTKCRLGPKHPRHRSCYLARRRTRQHRLSIPAHPRPPLLTWRTWSALRPSLRPGSLWPSLLRTRGPIASSAPRSRPTCRCPTLRAPSSPKQRAHNRLTRWSRLRSRTTRSAGPRPAPPSGRKHPWPLLRSLPPARSGSGPRSESPSLGIRCCQPGPVRPSPPPRVGTCRWWRRDRHRQPATPPGLSRCWAGRRRLLASPPLRCHRPPRPPSRYRSPRPPASLGLRGKTRPAPRRRPPSPANRSRPPTVRGRRHHPLGRVCRLLAWTPRSRWHRFSARAHRSGLSLRQGWPPRQGPEVRSPASSTTPFPTPLWCSPNSQRASLRARRAAGEPAAHGDVPGHHHLEPAQQLRASRALLRNSPCGRPGPARPSSRRCRGLVRHRGVGCLSPSAGVCRRRRVVPTRRAGATRGFAPGVAPADLPLAGPGQAPLLSAGPPGDRRPRSRPVARAPRRRKECGCAPRSGSVTAST